MEVIIPEAQMIHIGVYSNIIMERDRTTMNRLPVVLVHLEEFERIDLAFYREKQVQGWSRKKKEALIDGNKNLLRKLSECKNESHYLNFLKSLNDTIGG